MRRLLRGLAAIGCACTLAVPAAQAAPVPAEPSAPAPQPSELPADMDARLDGAEAAWTAGEFAEVRRLLEPVTEALYELPAVRRDKAVSTLADATINDASLDAGARTEAAAELLRRLLTTDPEFRMTKGFYSPELYEVYIEVVGELARAAVDQCRADQTACNADFRQLQRRHDKLRDEHTALQQQYAEQDVEIRDRVARSRVFAAIPLGVGHFYNGQRALGGTFLGAELAIGATGLTLLLYRLIHDGCRRRRAFQRGSLVCRVDDRDAVLRRRQAEEVMAWGLLLTVIADIAVAQAMFEPFEELPPRRVKRKDVDEVGAPERRRSRDRTPRRPRAKVRPTAELGPEGGSLGVVVDF